MSETTKEQPITAEPTTRQSANAPQSQAQPAVAAPTKIFKFTVGGDGKFSYDPTTDWAYNHTDRIRFETGSGPFQIRFVPVKPIPIPNFNPLNGPLDSVPGDGTFFADTSVVDDLTEEDRAMLIEGNKGPAFPKGYVGRYFYHIDVTMNGEKFSDTQKNGSYSC